MPSAEPSTASSEHQGVWRNRERPEVFELIPNEVGLRKVCLRPKLSPTQIRSASSDPDPGEVRGPRSEACRKKAASFADSWACLATMIHGRRFGVQVLYSQACAPPIVST